MNATVLLVEIDDAAAGRLSDLLDRESVRAVACSDPASALIIAKQENVQAVIIGEMVEHEAIDLARRVAETGQRRLFFFPRFSSERLAIEAVRLHACDYILQPDIAGLVTALLRHLGKLPGERLDEGHIVGPSIQAKQLRSSLRNIAASECSVLITGETGTGKELAAAAVHEWSTRHRSPFVAVNCAALPDSLFESELFGFEKGAFTGAQSSSKGRIAQAEGGTLFLDEIAELPPHGQAKLLRVLENHQVDRLGGSKPISINVRFVAATNQPLEKRIQSREFRSDLFYRLAVAQIHLTPLRERPADISALCRHFLSHINGENGYNIEGITPEVTNLFLAYGWPGNVRELRNVLDATAVERRSGEIRPSDLPGWFLHRCTERSPTSDERSKLLFALEQTGWNKKEAAAQLKCSRMTLYRKLARYGIEGGGLNSTFPAELGCESHHQKR